MVKNKFISVLMVLLALMSCSFAANVEVKPAFGGQAGQAMIG